MAANDVRGLQAQPRAVHSADAAAGAGAGASGSAPAAAAAGGAAPGGPSAAEAALMLDDDDAQLFDILLEHRPAARGPVIPKLPLTQAAPAQAAGGNDRGPGAAAGSEGAGEEWKTSLEFLLSQRPRPMD